MQRIGLSFPLFWGKLSRKAIISFFAAFTLCSIAICITVINRISVERLTMQQMIAEKSAKASEVISGLLYKTHVLATLVIQDGKEVGDFESVAATIVDDPAILNVLIAPGGVVSKVYPLQGNEAVIGFDFFSESAGNKEAMQARDTGTLVFGGPFDILQGGQALVGRLPVFTDMPDGSKEFWGLVSVTLKYPQVLDKTGFNELISQGFAYEVWRISPDTKDKQIITSSGYNYSDKTRYVEKQVSIANTEWYFRILPVRGWYEYPETWVLVFLGLCISFLIAFVVSNNEELTLLKEKFELMSQTDWLTGVYNRRHFLDLAAAQLDRASRLNSEAFIVIFDLDHFKDINDKYGHPIGDEVLKAMSNRVRSSMRSYDLLARYGGEEFIMLFTDINIENVQKLVERIRINVSKVPFEIGNAAIFTSASFGIAPATPVNDLDTAIRLADRALYTAKEKGRNNSVLYRDDLRTAHVSLDGV